MAKKDSKSTMLEVSDYWKNRPEPNHTGFMADIVLKDSFGHEVRLTMPVMQTEHGLIIEGEADFLHLIETLYCGGIEKRPKRDSLYSLRVTSPGPKWVQIIKVIRTHTETSLQGGKDIVKAGQALTGITKEVANTLESEILALGGTVKIEEIKR